ncbi:hypothetical protein [Chitinophaga sp. Cy-1792]|uniref:hypothetical protein n=1 Tax=Chitinophaga sp. Cy-1792 TaxID=2608339 RepID=UPI001422B370|nr:hypothetical protein [Chitinophaga sp. Cy-1792]NIG55022.1 hypothetical protein [Chitinophaga sp. Cy-1792]
MRSFLLHLCMIIVLPLLMWTISSCQKEKAMAPVEVPDLYVLPQGNQPYDDSIVAFHKKYGSYILYKFDTKDFSTSYNFLLPARAMQGNPAYVANTLQFFKSQCLAYYPEKFLQQTMPVRIFLAAAIDTVDAGHRDWPWERTVTGFYMSRTMLGIGWTDSTLLQKTPSELATIRSYMHRAYIQQAALAGSLKIPQEFMRYALPDYASPGSNDYASLGLLESPYGISSEQKNVAWDFSGFAGLITGHSKADLDTTFLSPSYDTKGLILAKYNVVVKFFLQQGIDLQAIGNLNP